MDIYGLVELHSMHKMSTDNFKIVILVIFNSINAKKLKKLNIYNATIKISLLYPCVSVSPKKFPIPFFNSCVCGTGIRTRIANLALLNILICNNDHHGGGGK